MKRSSALIAMLALVLTGLVFVAPTASAKVDKRACVSRAEFRAVHRNMTQAQVRKIFDISGYMLNSYTNYVDDGYWDSDYIDDGYWQDEDFDGDGVTDNVIWIDEGYWLDQWVDTSYTETDLFKTYKKCKDKNFDRGHGRVAINFDDYTSPYSGFRLYDKFRNTPWVSDARAIPNKARPTNKTPQNTPAPHRNLKRTVIKK